MNIISLTIWMLEENYYVIYVIIACVFVCLAVFHKKITNRTITRVETPVKIEKLAGKKWVEVGARGIPAKSLHRLLKDLGLPRSAVPSELLWNGFKMALTGSYSIWLSREGSEHNAERDFPDDDEDPEMLLPAIPEDTPHIPYKPARRPDEEVIQRSREFYEIMAKRRTVRAFSTEPIPQEVLDNIVRTAGTAPSGAHTEPWSFVVVQDAETKAAIREIVEQEEEINYAKRMSRQWVTDLKPFATKFVKPYLTDAPALILMFRQTHSIRPDGKKKMHYYSELSLAISAGILLTAIHYCGLVALTSTPLNCHARLRTLLSRPGNEKLELLFPVGRPHAQATVPDLGRKTLEEISVNF